MAKSMLRMGRCVRFCWQHFIPSHKERQGFPLLSVLDFRCFRVIALANHKRTFDERIGCITRHDDFVPRSHRAVFTASLSKDCKDWGCRRGAGQTENEWVYLIQVYTAPSSLCLWQYPPKVSHCSRNRILVSSGKSLTFITNYVFLVTKYDGNYNW